MTRVKTGSFSPSCPLPASNSEGCFCSDGIGPIWTTKTASRTHLSWRLGLSAPLVQTQRSLSGGAAAVGYESVIAIIAIMAIYSYVYMFFRYNNTFKNALCLAEQRLPDIAIAITITITITTTIIIITISITITITITTTITIN